MISKPAIIFALQAEIVHAEAQLQPHDTGHINTAISWMKHRVRELKQEIRDQHDRATKQSSNDPHNSISHWDGEDQYDPEVDGF
jgi:hypothetical protein